MGAKGYGFLADAILLLHFAFVLFVAGGLIAIWIGYFARWGFVRNPWFRAMHLLAMGVVVAESVFGVICPLTTWEADWRMKAGEGPSYSGSFVQHWVHRVMFFEVPEGTFTVIYVVFFALIVLSLVIVRPRSFRGSHP
jgi:hypothetical protein